MNYLITVPAASDRFWCVPSSAEDGCELQSCGFLCAARADPGQISGRCQTDHVQMPDRSRADAGQIHTGRCRTDPHGQMPNRSTRADVGQIRTGRCRTDHVQMPGQIRTGRYRIDHVQMPDRCSWRLCNVIPVTAEAY